MGFCLYICMSIFQHVMIELKNICKRFGNVEVLRDVDLRISDRLVTSVVGPSGAGKSTLLQILGTLDRADSGRVLYDGVDVAGLNDRRLSAFRNDNIGFVFQNHHSRNIQDKHLFHFRVNKFFRKSLYFLYK